MLRRSAEASRFGARVLHDVADLPPAPPGAGDGLERRFITADLPLDALASAARAAGGTVQDTLVAGLVEGCRRYNAHWDVDRPFMRVFSPYGKAPLTRHTASVAGNHWFIIRFEVPAGPAQPSDRIRSRTRHHAAGVHRDALDWMGAVARIAPAVPGPLLQVAFRRFAASHDFIISNIPGPRQTIRIADVPVRRL